MQLFSKICLLLILIVSLDRSYVCAKKAKFETADERMTRMHKEHNERKQTEWNKEYLKTNKVHNARNQQARLKTIEKKMRKEKKLKESKAGKEAILKGGFGDKFKRDRFEL